MSTPEDLTDLYTYELKDLWSANDRMQRCIRKLAPKHVVAVYGHKPATRVTTVTDTFAVQIGASAWEAVGTSKK